MSHLGSKDFYDRDAVRAARKANIEKGLYGGLPEEDLIKGGEGSRGGKVVGHTKSGKPVYEKIKSLADFKDWTAQDHHDARMLHAGKAKLPDSESYNKLHENIYDFHSKRAEWHYGRAKEKEKQAKRDSINNDPNDAYRKLITSEKLDKEHSKRVAGHMKDKTFTTKEHVEATKQALLSMNEENLFKSEDDDIEKGGEGSKGGKVIGHTRNGHPIYANQKASKYSNWTAGDHEDASSKHEDQLSQYESAKGVTNEKAYEAHQEHAADHARLSDRMNEEKSSKHISDMSKEEKHAAAEHLKIKGYKDMTEKELDKHLTDKNIEKQLKEFKENKKKGSIKKSEEDSDISEALKIIGL